MRAIRPACSNFAQRALQFLLAIGRQPQPPEQFRHVRRDVIAPSEQIQNAIFHKEYFR